MAEEIEKNENSISTEKATGIIDVDGLTKFISELKDISAQYSKIGDDIIEGASYCTEKDFAIEGVGMDTTLYDCGVLYKDKSRKIQSYAESLEDGLKIYLRKRL